MSRSTCALMQAIGAQGHRDDTEDVDATLFLFGFPYGRAVP
jgi:hypothetical protein